MKKNKLIVLPGKISINQVDGLNEFLNPKSPSEQYLTFKVLENSTFSFSGSSLQYSIDGGSTWTTGTTSPEIKAGDKIMWKQEGLAPGEYGIGTFSATGNFKAYGNIMSLYYGDNFVGQTSLEGKDKAFYKLFMNNTHLIDAKDLVLPATTLAQYCYFGMFRNCTSLTEAPELPATTMAESCYQSMFWDCTSLTEAPVLPATTLAQYCYSSMFQNCTSLTEAPELPATTLTPSCYSNMFQNCTSLTEAPELPATTLAGYCYSYMFSDCSSLNSIKCLATDISEYSCTTSWVSGVSGTGTFIKANSTSWTTGTSGIPDGWTSYTESEYKEVRHYELSKLISNINTDPSKQCLTFEAIQDTTFTFTRNALQYSLDNGSTWTTLSDSTASPTVTAGSKIMWKQTGLTPNSSNGIGIFSATGNFRVSGNIMSLYYGDNFSGQTDLTGKTYAFSGLFMNNTYLIDAKDLILPATTLATACYMYMFSGCTSLMKTSELPATTLAPYCYMYMFQDCSSLEEAPELPATVLAQSCYENMFSGSTHLGYIKCLATDISASNCTSGWVQNVGASGTFIRDNNMFSWETGNTGIPSGWTSCTESGYKEVRRYELDPIESEFESIASILDRLNQRISELEAIIENT